MIQAPSRLDWREQLKLFKESPLGGSANSGGSSIHERTGRDEAAIRIEMSVYFRRCAKSEVPKSGSGSSPNLLQR